MDLKQTLNNFGKNKKPFFFCISYDMQKWDVMHLDKINKQNIYCTLLNDKITSHNMKISKTKISKSEYFTKIEKIMKQIKKGNTYLLNLTASTKIELKNSLFDIYKSANSKYKLYYKDKFVSFSPESFVSIKDNKIYTFPMKGTIKSNIKNAKQKILNDKKELAEHTMIVDLLRNDLSIISQNVKVDKFRYVQEIKAGDENLLQVSSQISGKLQKNWHENIGDILTSLLPAGSITGAPKKSTINIIDDIEEHKRDYFSGIFGIFDGNSLNSAVLIRFIEKNGDKIVYKSGGGITLDSQALSEYDELNDKIYIP